MARDLWDVLYRSVLAYMGQTRNNFLLNLLQTARSEAEIESIIYDGLLDAAVEAILGEPGQSVDPLYHGLRAAMSDFAESESVRAGESRFATRWDLADPRAMRYIQDTRLHLIREIDGPTREMVRNLLAFQMARGVNPKKMVRELVGPVDRRGLRIVDSRGIPVGGVIGLTERQRRAVENFRRMLEEGDYEALQRKLRDRRFDGTIRRIIRGEKVPQSKIDYMVARYQSRMLAYRAETIARTESLRAMQRGRAMFWASQNQIPLSDLEKRWNTARDERVRVEHRLMEGIIVPFGDSFRLPLSGESTDWPPHGVNCRCLASVAIKGTAHRFSEETAGALATA